ncbi:GlxA family transcriptional regulator [Methylobacterium nonmethylotrophicum]|uniref:GlxA family transcriptional regulator n=1 Tax=Methylobacterium nonmethylotrophicum TaxID=1141884 RepID=A0A4Z0NNE5_9HYPH|nr:GlxA family transcriptional regulator [Methylobacterium nonmethylotrophicum]TGD97676.1 GlxA family transcriptional regulator [Methylobacterium nonmethylotrophicum]
MRKVGVVVAPGLQLMSIAALAVFQAANVLLEDRVYETRLVSEGGGEVPTAAGFAVASRPLEPEIYDTLLVAARIGTEPAPAALVAFTREAAATSRRVGALCTGAFTLAQAGLLSQRRATTHWRHARELQARFPDIRIEADRLFVNDGPIWTSAGMMAGIDMTLALVEADLGADVARTIARRMILDRRRPGADPQASGLLELEPRTDRIRKVLDHVRRHLRDDLSVARMAAVANLSPRQLGRACAAEFGESPAKLVERLRAEAARALLIEGRHSCEAVADRVGFADRERMRRAFLRLYGRPPQDFRRTTHPSVRPAGTAREEA